MIWLLGWPDRCGIARISKCTAPTQLGWHRYPQGGAMLCRCVLIHHRRSLSAAVADRAVEIHCIDAMFAASTFERRAAAHWLGRVISHIFIVVLPPTRDLGQQVCDLGARKRVTSGECRWSIPGWRARQTGLA